MTRKEDRATEIEALQRLLEGHGADRTRWPAPDRLRFASLLAENAEARRLVAEAMALDRLLELAPTVGSDREQEIGARILALAQAGRWQEEQRTTQSRTQAATVPGAERGRAPLMAHAGMKLLPAALLAASLLVGVFAGSNGAFQDLLRATGFDRDIQQATLDDDAGDFLNAEELL